MRGRRLALALATIAAVAIALPALAQEQLTPLDVKIRVVPNKAGTSKHPRPVEMNVKAELSPQDPNAEPILDKGTIRLGKGILWNGAKHPKCTAQTLNSKGLGACPKRSVFGGFNRFFTEPPRPAPRIIAVNGGKNLALAYVQLTNPARVNVAVPIKIKQRTGKWAYELSYDVPSSLQFVAGVPIPFTILWGKIGKGDILATTFCPRNHKWKYDSTATLLDGRVIKHAGTVACRR